MRTALKIFGFILAVILTLSIKISEKPIFSYIYSVISPATDIAQQATEDFVSFSVARTKHYSKKLFDNSVPRVRDSVKSKMSGIKKTDAAQEPEEEILVDEKEELDDLIKDHH